MIVKWDLFDMLFPEYYTYRTPMWFESKEEDNNFLLEIVIPGYDKEDISLYVEDGRLILDVEKEGKRYLHYSILGSHSGRNYDLQKAEAKYKSGVLKITVPKLVTKSLSKHEIKVS